jgi:hypothetical protein
MTDRWRNCSWNFRRPSMRVDSFYSALKRRLSMAKVGPGQPIAKVTTASISRVSWSHGRTGLHNAKRKGRVRSPKQGLCVSLAPYIVAPHPTDQFLLVTPLTSIYTTDSGWTLPPLIFAPNVTKNFGAQLPSQKPVMS